MTARETYNEWLRSGELTEDEISELEAIADNEDEIEARFFGPLEFGTAGLRGVMGMGTARMNPYVIRHTTQAFADVINASGEENPVCAVCCDCRNESRAFAEDAASVLAANGIGVLLFSEMRPTPELSFAVRRFGCTAGINITASHNPPEYNGYKVYGSDGAQLSPEKAELVARRAEELHMFRDVRRMPLREAVSRGLVKMLGDETDREYFDKTMSLMTDPHIAEASGISIVYTPFHGTGRTFVPEVLRALGVKNLFCVEAQMIPDGNFPTVKSPNPENPEGFRLAVKLAEEKNADLIIGTDPDADRIGILVRGADGFVPLSGNQTGALLLDYYIGALKRCGRMPEKPVALKTIVSTELVRRIAEREGVKCFETFTGFKFMAQKKNELEAAGDGKVIFSFEESFGYMLGDHVRDKDGISAALLISEMAAWYLKRGMTLLEALDTLYEKYGWYAEKTVNLVMPGLDGAEKMQGIMASLRNEPPADICGEKVVSVTDYLAGTVTCGGNTKASELSGSDVLRFALDDGTVILARPSGTEPKIKIYILARSESRDGLNKTDRFGAWAECLTE